MQRSVIKKYGIYSTFLFVVIFLSVLSVVLILTGILFPTGMILFEIGLFEQIFQYYDFTKISIVCKENMRQYQT